MDEARPRGDADLAALGALLADPGRCRMLLALDDGRALPAGRLAEEAGVSAATASAHLRRLTTGGLLEVEPDGRHRYYRLAGPEIGQLLEGLGRVAPRQQVRSLRQSVRAEAMRNARTCYDHVAGRLGVAVMATLLQRGDVAGGDGRYDPATAVWDHHAGYGRDIGYRLTEQGSSFLDGFGVERSAGRPPVRYCVDWTEQRHHLAGAVGSGLLNRLLALDWVRRSPHSRALDVTPVGRAGLERLFDVRV